MKNKKLMYLLCAVTLAFSMCACSAASEETAQNGSEVGEVQVQEVSETQEAEDKEAEGNEYYSPSEEIINAPINSGLIQVGNIVVKEGGYITVGDFITTYGEYLDTSFYEGSVESYNTWWERNADERFRHVLSLPIKDTDITLSVSYVSMKSVTPDKNTVWDCAVVDVCASSESGQICEWYPGGIASGDMASLDEARTWLSENGFTENTEYVYEKNTYMFLDVNNPGANINNYATINMTDTLSYVVAIIEADEVNLFGEKPVMSYFISDLNSKIGISYGNRMYLNAQNTWKSEIR